MDGKFSAVKELNTPDFKYIYINCTVNDFEDIFL